ncbi:MAG: hypothetical protein PHE36_06165 [Novosphingobium sp.]|nr:hypothetical protein [Novosphingobium sp.]
MKRALLLGGAALALCSTLVVAQDAPESLLPPGFDNPAPAPAPSAPRPSASAAPVAGATSSPVVQPLPGETAPAIALPGKLPSIEQIEAMTPDEIDELLGLKPKFDIPPAARRSMAQVGVIDRAEGGMPANALAKQPASLVRAALKGSKGPVVSRWGHILLRRTLASRLAAPEGMSPVEFAALRAAVLNDLGESAIARALVQGVDTANYDAALTDAAFDAYIGTADLLGICPATRLHGGIRKDPQWQMAVAICDAYAGEGNSAKRELDKALSRGIAPRIDILLAQRFAGAAGDGRGAVTIEWDDVAELNPWRFALANALGMDIPEKLARNETPYYLRSAAIAPMLPLAQRAEAVDIAGGDGILSSEAMVDLYSQIYADDEVTGDTALRATRLREAYVAEAAEDRLAALRDVWGGSTPDYGRLVLTAYAAARIPASEDLAGDAAPLLASMLAAGLDGNAMRWGRVVKEGTTAWGLLTLAQPVRRNPVATAAVESFIDDDASANQRKSRFLVAGLAGLGRLDPGAAGQLSGTLGVDLSRQTRWSRMIDKAAEVNNPVLVSLLAGLGMQGTGWDKMTARHLYHIVSALNRVGLKAEARMIAAEAVARG